MYENNVNGSSDLFELFARAQWLMHRYHQVNHHKHGPMGDPHRGQGRVLTLLRMQPQISQKDLGYLLGMRPQSLSELLVKLEQSGYITRAASESDKRVMDIRLTDEGKIASEEVQRPDRGSMFDCLNDEEQAAFADYLRRIITGLESQFGEEYAKGNFEWRGGRGRIPFGEVTGPCPEFVPGPHPEFVPGPGFEFHGGMEHAPFDKHERDHRGFGPDGMRRDGGFHKL